MCFYYCSTCYKAVRMFCINTEQVDKDAPELMSNLKLIEIIANVARRVPTGDAGYKTDVF